MRWLTNVLAWSVFALILFVFSPAALADKRVALVVGIGAYQHAPSLSNPTRDAKAIAEMFQKAGFDAVQARYDVGNLDFKRALREFLDEAKTADIAVVFFAGHGIQIGDQNYMIPVDAKLAREYDAKDEAISLERIVEAIEPAARLRLVILDACRDNPFIARMQRRVSTRAVAPGGLAKVEPTFTDTLIAYAAKAGLTADDGNGDHSPFTAALLKHITEPGLDVRLAFGRIRDEVRKTTNDEQEPFVYGSLGGSNISLVPPPTVPKLDAFVQVKGDYELVERINSRKAWEVFINHHKEGMYVDLARERLRMLDSAAPASGEQRVASLPPATSPTGPSREQNEAWNRVKDSQDPAVVRRFIERNKSSPHVLAAQSLLENLEKAVREREAAAETKRLAEEARKQAEAKRLAEEKAAAEARRAEEARKQAEAKRIAEERAAAEAKRLAEESRKQAEVRKLTEEQAAAEAKKLIEETRKSLEAKRLAEERAVAEAKRLAEEARKQVEARKLAEERAAAEAQRAKQAEQAGKQAEAQRLAEERATEAERVRKAEEARKQADAKRVADEKAAAEAKRLAEEKATAEAKRIAAEAERVRRAEEARKQAEVKKLADDKAAAEAKRMAEKAAADAKQAAAEKAAADQAAAEAKRVAEKAAADAERARKAEEAQRLAEAKKRAEEHAAAEMKTVRLAQLELRRIGCFSGRDDGLLNQATKEAIGLYHAKVGKRSIKLDVTDEFIDELKKREQRVCPLVCRDDQVVQGEQCVAKAAPEKAEKIKPAQKQRAKDEPKQASKSRRDDDPPRRQREAGPVNRTGGGGTMTGVGF